MEDVYCQRIKRVCVLGTSQFFRKRGVSCAGFRCEELCPKRILSNIKKSICDMGEMSIVVKPVTRSHILPY